MFSHWSIVCLIRFLLVDDDYGDDYGACVSVQEFVIFISLKIVVASNVLAEAW